MRDQRYKAILPASEAATNYALAELVAIVCWNLVLYRTAAPASIYTYPVTDCLCVVSLAQLLSTRPNSGDVSKEESIWVYHSWWNVTGDSASMSGRSKCTLFLLYVRPSSMVWRRYPQTFLTAWKWNSAGLCEYWLNAVTAKAISEQQVAIA